MMLVIPNNHVIVPRTEEISIEITNVANSQNMKRRAHVNRFVLNNTSLIQLDFIPVSDQWLELYLDGYRVINPKYATLKTSGIRYENYNLIYNNQIRFETPLTGNLKVVCDTLAVAPGETWIDNVPAGIVIDFDNIQNYDIFEKRFNPRRYPIPALELTNSALRVRVGDSHYAEPFILTEPCYGHVRLTKDRKNLVYTPRPGYKGYDVFGYSLMTTHGQMGKPQACTVKVQGPEDYYNYSAEFLSSFNHHLALRDHKHPFIAALGSKIVTIEFFYFTKTVVNDGVYKVGVYGQYRNEPVDGRMALYLQGTSADSDQVVVLQYCISSLDIYGNVVYADFRMSSRARLKQNRWHHVVVQIDSTVPAATSTVMYLDGYAERFYFQDFTAQTTINNAYYLIGKVNDQAASQNFNGYISNFRFLENLMPYSGDRIQIPRRTLANVAQAKILTIVNNINDPQSIQDMADLTRVQKIGNVKVVDTGPFSPVVLNSSMYEVMHGDVIEIQANSDYICRDTIVHWQVNANVSIGEINNSFWSSNAPNLVIRTLTDLDQVHSVSYSSGNLVIDYVDRVEITVDTKSKVMQSARKVDFFLTDYPLMIETYTVLADPNGLVLNIDPSNDGFARDTVNFNHGQPASISQYNSSLGGYFDFNGTSDQIIGSHNKAINLLDDMTCEVWFRIRNPQALPITVLTKGLTGNLSYRIYYNTTNNAIGFSRERISSNIQLEYQFASSIVSNWYQVVATSSGIDHKLYINGQIVYQKYFEYEPVLENNLGYVLGSNLNSQFHDGQISFVRLYNRALSAMEVLDSFDLYRSNYGL